MIALQKKATCGSAPAKRIKECAFFLLKQGTLELLLPAQAGCWRLCQAGIVSPRPLGCQLNSYRNSVSEFLLQEFLQSCGVPVQPCSRFRTRWAKGICRSEFWDRPSCWCGQRAEDVEISGSSLRLSWNSPARADFTAPENCGMVWARRDFKHHPDPPAIGRDPFHHPRLFPPGLGCFQGSWGNHSISGQFPQASEKIPTFWAQNIGLCPGL